jgi:hypothetical protein
VRMVKAKRVDKRIGCLAMTFPSSDIPSLKPAIQT